MCFTCTILWASQVALVIENPPTNAGDTRDTGSIRGLDPWKRKRQLTSCLENSVDRETGYDPWGCRESDTAVDLSTCTTLCLLCIHHRRVFTSKSLVSISHHRVDPLYPSTFPSLPFPSGNQYSALDICVFLWFA